MAIFNSDVSHFQRVYPIKSHETTIFLWFSYGFPIARCRMKAAPANIYSPEVMAALRSRGGDGLADEIYRLWCLNIMIWCYDSTSYTDHYVMFKCYDMMIWYDMIWYDMICICILYYDMYIVHLCIWVVIFKILCIYNIYIYINTHRLLIIFISTLW